MRCSWSQALSVLVVSRVAFLRRVPLSMVPYLETRGAVGRQEAFGPSGGCVFMVVRPGLHPCPDLHRCPRGLLFWAKVQRGCFLFVYTHMEPGLLPEPGRWRVGTSTRPSQVSVSTHIYLRTRLCNAHGQNQNWSSAPLGRMHLCDLSAQVIVSPGKMGVLSAGRRGLAPQVPA